MSNVLQRKIKTITLINFQNHKHSKFDLTNGINLLVGSSDSGKTAVARAIDFVIYNNSEGNDYVHIGEKHATVEIEFIDGAFIRRTKGDRLNKVEYRYAEDEDLHCWVAFSTTYPEDVVKFLGNPPKSKLLGAMSYSNQSNKNFLVDLPETQIPGVISDLIGVSDLEESAILLSSKVKAMDSEIKSIDRDIVNIQKQLDEDYIDLDEKVEKATKIKNLISESSKIEKEKLLVKNYQDKYNTVRIRANDSRKEKEKAEKIIEILSEKIDNLKTIEEELVDKKNISNTYENYTISISDIEKTVKKYKTISDGNFKKLVETAETFKTNMKSLNDMNGNVETVEADISDCKNEISNLNNKIKETKKKINDLVVEIKEKGYYCETCGTIPGEKI